MELDKNKFSLAAAATLGVVYVVCAIVVAIAPEFAAQLMSWLTHLVNLEARVVGFPGVIYGFLQVVIYTYVAAWLFAWLHNRFIKKP
mgnify:FL=1